MKDKLYQRNNILNKAIEKYGEDLQLDVAIEEMAELTKEIVKHKRGKGDINRTAEELADVYIMLKQLIIIFDIPHDSINKMVDKKIERLERNLQDD